MSGAERDPTSPAVEAVDDGEGNVAIKTAQSNGGSPSKSNGQTKSILPRLHVPGGDSVAYITVNDPTEFKEGIKGRFTMYRVAYDPPLPTADTATDATANTNGSRGLFPYATSVNRRYSDFSWLFDHLHKERPGAIVPPLPEKQQVSRFSDSFIEERRFHLEIFLRRVVCNPELKDTECLLIFLGGGDAEFKKAKKDGSFGTRSGGAGSNVDAALNQTLSDDYNLHDEDEHRQDHTLVEKGKGKLGLSTKKAGIKKWIKEKKTTMQGTMIRQPDDGVFEQVTHFISALEAGLKRVEAQASAMEKRDKGASASLLEFGLGCDALAHIESEINGEGPTDESSSGIGQTYHLVGKTADAISAISSEHYERELCSFHEPLRDHLKMVHAVKVALSKRNNRRITYSTCLNAVDSKKASLHKYRITQDQKAFGVEASLSRAEQSVFAAKANYEECASRVLREVDRFRKENAMAMYTTMLEFARVQKEYHDKMNQAFGALLPQIETVDATKFNGHSFAETAAALREGKNGQNGSHAVEGVTAQVDTMDMPSYPPPTEPAAGNGVTNLMEGSVLNGAVRYRDPLPEE